MSLPTAMEIRDYLESFCDTDTAVSDGWITMQRNSIVTWVESKIRQSLAGTKQYEELVSGTGSKVLFLSRRDVVSVDTIEYVNLPSDGLVTVNAVEVVPGEGVIRAKDNLREGVYSIFPKGTYNIRVRYTAGFEEVPEDIKVAIIQLTCERILSQLAGGSGGGTSVNINGYSKTYGNRGKYTEIRNDLTRWGVAALRKYMTGVVAS